MRVRPRIGSGSILLAGVVLAVLGLRAEPGGLARQDVQQPTTGPGIPFTTGYGTSDSNRSMIAVTGMDVTGASLLFLVDTESKHLSIYQATGGTGSTMNVRWVAGRNIGLDLQVNGYNDKSQYSYEDLESQFESIDTPQLPVK